MTDFRAYQSVFRFLLTGGLAAATEYMVFLVLHHVSPVSLVVANTISFLCGLVFSFTLNKHWVFGHKSNGGLQFAMYLALALINLCIGNVLIVWLIESADIAPFIAKLGVMILIASWNFFIFRGIIFHKK